MGVQDDDGGRWTIRNVPPGLQRRAATAARKRGLKLGAWVSEAVRAALRREPAGRRKSEADADTDGKDLAAVARRLDRLERAVFKNSGAGGRPRLVAEVNSPARPVEIDSDLMRRYFLAKLHGASAEHVAKTLNISIEVARQLGKIKFG